MKLSILSALNSERANRRAAVVVTDVASGEQRLVKGADVAKDPLKELIEKHIRSGKSGMEETPSGKVFLTVHVPPPKLVITGAVHISQALAPIAKLLGYDVTIVDPRTAFATRSCRRSASTDTPPSSRSRTTRRSTIRRSCTRCRRSAFISARSARGKRTDAGSNG
jgi:xanthine/CO dehydrogenase XdhC/CoxF family maturation factor